MSKKMKRVAFDSTPRVFYEDARARSKYQTLLQDFLELQQETEASRNKLMALKQKKLTLQADVRFLRKRREFLMKNKPPVPRERFFAKPKPTRIIKSKKETVRAEKSMALCKLEKKKAFRTPVLHLNIENESGLHGVNEQPVQRAIRGSNPKQRVRISGPKGAPFLDLNQKYNTFRGREPVGKTRVPVIDLNQVSREAEESQDGFEPIDLRSEGLARNGAGEEHTDVKLSICRDVGSGSGSGLGSTGGPGKRKISWQDPVALRV